MSRSLASIWRATWVGFDAIGTGLHPSFAQALETSMVCEIPFETLDDLPEKCPICVSR
ncbi:transcriptional regulation of aerobic, anaerobic respiration, osmotic balance [Klebsiella pneumoniae]|uniref:Transcriptional regulation of aerobic, anaerobic respiration, osmotic balance n=1 Tax=Klebsiella pneumoniae TaxID=573 RepID=A0A378C8Z8_KLEPN|nr:transcriptional regulation of aerobic, anaerobic respiration, osmotic balance [Klebsiella pneumoniae]